MEIKARIIQGELNFGTPITTHGVKEALKKNEGKEVKIVIMGRESGNMRRFFEGAVIPYLFYQHPHSGWDNFKECREAIKNEFNPVYIKGFNGRVTTAPGSTAMRKDKFNQFLEKIERYCMENGFEFPNSEDFREWDLKHPLIGDIYPPLKRLIDKYHEEK